MLEGYLDTIKWHGLEPSAITCTTFMNAHCKEGNMDSLLALLQEMEKKAIGPTHVTYTVVIKGLVETAEATRSCSIT